MGDWGPFLTGLAGAIPLAAAGALAWVKFFRSEVPASAANIDYREAETAEVIGRALGAALEQMKTIAADRLTENIQLREEVGVLRAEVASLRTQVHELSTQVRRPPG